MRYFLEFSYDGTAYHGWQVQPNALTVQEVLNDALSKILRAGIFTTGAGRTDTGVHALQMFAHFDFSDPLDASLLVRRLNSFLPADIAIHRVFRVKDDAHARYSALSRMYRYFISREKDAFACNRQWYLPAKNDLDVEAMNRAATLLYNYQDFECFSKVNTDVNHFRCRIDEAVWYEEQGRLVFRIRADRFLRNMVRAIVGTLIEVGKGKMNREDFQAVIESRNRSAAGMSVPACGLYLAEVEYPPDIYY